MITYQGIKLSSKFQAKDQTKFEHRNDVVYCSKCPENDCDDFYIGETGRQISERIIDHSKRDKNSHPLQHAQNKTHAHVWVNDFTILNVNYRSKIKRKISESLYIRSKKPTLNKKEFSSNAIWQVINPVGQNISNHIIYSVFINRFSIESIFAVYKTDRTKVSLQKCSANFWLTSLLHGGSLKILLKSL